VHGWDQFPGSGCSRPPAGTRQLAALAQLRARRHPRRARRQHPPLPCRRPRRRPRPRAATAASATLEPQIPPRRTRPRPGPRRAGPAQPASRRSKLSIAETIQLTILARASTPPGLITPRPGLAFSAALVTTDGRVHQAAARWHHYSARLLAHPRQGNQRRTGTEVTLCNRISETGVTLSSSAATRRKNRDCNTGVARVTVQAAVGGYIHDELGIEGHADPFPAAGWWARTPACFLAGRARAGGHAGPGGQFRSWE